MKKLITIVFECLLFWNGTINAQPILNPNGGFEEDSVGSTTADPWFFGKASGQAEFTVIDSVAHSGEKSLLINVIEKATGNFWDIQAVYEHIPTTPNTYYRATFWARSTEGFTLSAAIGTYDWKDLTNTTVTLTNEWTRISLVCYNEEKDELRVPLNRFEQGMYFIDDMSFIESPIGGSVVVPTGDSIIIQALTNLEEIPANFDVNSFTVTVNGVNNSVTKVGLIPNNTKYFYLILTNKIAADELVVINHTGGKIFYYNTTLAPDDNIIAFTDTAYNMSKYNVGINYGFATYAPLSFGPNPANEFIQLNSKETFKSIGIYDVQGKLVKQLKTTNNHRIYLTDISSGVYYIKAITTDGKYYSAKLMKY